MRRADRHSNRGRCLTAALCLADGQLKYYKLTLYKLVLTLLLLALGLFVAYYRLSWQESSRQSFKDSYISTLISNRLCRQQLSLLQNSHQRLKERFKELRNQKEAIRDLVELTTDSPAAHVAGDSPLLPITAQRVSSAKGEFGRVLIGGVAVIEYFDASQRPVAYRRALVTAERMKLAHFAAPKSKRYTIRQRGQKAEALLNNRLLFVVRPQDLLFTEERTDSSALAQEWLDATRRELANYEQGLAKLERDKPKGAGYLKWQAAEGVAGDIDYTGSLTLSRSLDSDQLQNMLKVSQQELANYRSSFEELHQIVKAERGSLEFIPSRYPVATKFIASDFGWRVHPIFGTSRFHSGIDLPIWEGAAIKATASGLVKFSGWRGGYGRCVVIDHGGGITTMYAHNQTLQVKRGEVVKKGQVISLAGSTGLSQGPHCHYEVQFFNCPVDPKRFLSRDILASSKHW